MELISMLSKDVAAVVEGSGAGGKWGGGGMGLAPLGRETLFLGFEGSVHCKRRELASFF
jgi:hypothetical protein